MDHSDTDHQLLMMMLQGGGGGGPAAGAGGGGVVPVMGASAAQSSPHQQLDQMNLLQLQLMMQSAGTGAVSSTGTGASLGFVAPTASHTLGSTQTSQSQQLSMQQPSQINHDQTSAAAAMYSQQQQSVSADTATNNFNDIFGAFAATPQSNQRSSTTSATTGLASMNMHHSPMQSWGTTANPITQLPQVNLNQTLNETSSAYSNAYGQVAASTNAQSNPQTNINNNFYSLPSASTSIQQSMQHSTMQQSLQSSNTAINNSAPLSDMLDSLMAGTASGNQFASLQSNSNRSSTTALFSGQTGLHGTQSIPTQQQQAQTQQQQQQQFQSMANLNMLSSGTATFNPLQPQNSSSQANLNFNTNTNPSPSTNNFSPQSFMQTQSYLQNNTLPQTTQSSFNESNVTQSSSFIPPSQLQQQSFMPALQQQSPQLQQQQQQQFAPQQFQQLQQQQQQLQMQQQALQPQLQQQQSNRPQQLQQPQQQQSNRPQQLQQPQQQQNQVLQQHQSLQQTSMHQRQQSFSNVAGSSSGLNLQQQSPQMSPQINAHLQQQQTRSQSLSTLQPQQSQQQQQFGNQQQQQSQLQQFPQLQQQQQPGSAQSQLSSLLSGTSAMQPQQQVQNRNLLTLQHQHQQQPQLASFAQKSPLQQQQQQSPLPQQQQKPHLPVQQIPMQQQQQQQLLQPQQMNQAAGQFGTSPNQPFTFNAPLPSVQNTPAALASADANAVAQQSSFKNGAIGPNGRPVYGQEHTLDYIQKFLDGLPQNPSPVISNIGSPQPIAKTASNSPHTPFIVANSMTNPSALVGNILAPSGTPTASPAQPLINPSGLINQVMGAVDLDGSAQKRQRVHPQQLPTPPKNGSPSPPPVIGGAKAAKPNGNELPAQSYPPPVLRTPLCAKCNVPLGTMRLHCESYGTQLIVECTNCYPATKSDASSTSTKRRRENDEEIATCDACHARVGKVTFLSMAKNTEIDSRLESVCHSCATHYRLCTACDGRTAFHSGAYRHASLFANKTTNICSINHAPLPTDLDPISIVVYALPSSPAEVARHALKPSHTGPPPPTHTLQTLTNALKASVETHLLRTSTPATPHARLLATIEEQKRLVDDHVSGKPGRIDTTGGSKTWRFVAVAFDVGGRVCSFVTLTVEVTTRAAEEGVGVQPILRVVLLLRMALKERVRTEVAAWVKEVKARQGAAVSAANRPGAASAAMT